MEVNFYLELELGVQKLFIMSTRPEVCSPYIAFNF